MGRLSGDFEDVSGSAWPSLAHFRYKPCQFQQKTFILNENLDVIASSANFIYKERGELRFVQLCMLRLNRYYSMQKAPCSMYLQRCISFESELSSWSFFKVVLAGFRSAAVYTTHTLPVRLASWHVVFTSEIWAAKTF